MGGRLSRAAMHEETTCPVILPRQHYISKLTMQHVHKQLGHTREMKPRVVNFTKNLSGLLMQTLHVER